MRRERGVAAITAILIVAVAASTATFMLAQQSAMVDQAALVAARAQAERFADAGFDWARGVIGEDGKQGSIDYLGEGWAQPIVGLPVERAVVAGAIEDAQGRFNLNNLVAEGRSEADLEILQRLLQQVGLPAELADNVMEALVRQPFAQVEELYRIRGFDGAAVAKLRPHVTALPGRRRIPVNVNTASEEVLAAIVGGKVPPERIAERLRTRRTKPFASTNDIAQWAAGADPRVASGDLAVRTDFFLVRVSVGQDEVQLASEALVQRNPQGGATTLVWRRPVY